MSVSLFDRALSIVAPRAAAKRVYAKVAFDQARGYAGAALGRNTDGWRTASTSADAEIYAAGARLRDRHRDLVRNNPHAAKAVSSWVTNLVGDGIKPRTDDKKAMAAFKTWANECDADGQLDFYGLQTLAVREMVEGGEVLARRRQRFSSDGLSVPLQIQLLEGDFLDFARTGAALSGSNNIVVNGVEFDAIGRRQAYWLYSYHPGSNVIGVGTYLVSKSVPASEVLHLYEKQRTQVRGVPWGAPILRDLRDISDFDFAELVRKKIESTIVGVVTSLDGEDGVTGTGPARLEDAQGNLIEKMSPGMFAYARNGKDVKFNSPASIGGYGEYKTVRLRDIAAGYRMPYELLTGDLSGVNYSSIRAGLIEYRRLVRAIQRQIIIPMYCQPIWDWFCEAAYLAGKIDQPKVPVLWDSPKFDWVDPYKDALADLLAMRAGARTLPEVIAERGGNIDDQLDEIAATNKKLDAREIVLDSDPRKVSKLGVVQPLDPEDVNDPGNTPPAATGKPAASASVATAAPKRSDGTDDALLNALLAIVSRDERMIEMLRAQKAPVVHVKAPISVNPPAAPPKRAERTVVTKHDERGRIVEFERHEIAETA